ncbi:MAG: ATP-dependent DNA helicase RecG [Bacteroidetes bacterium]|nr:ATP-dependent DNA helicase RecG [Bacteroidota bacterium]
MNAFLETPIVYLKGVGPQRAELLSKELYIRTYGDLLNHFPFRYIDRSEYQTIRDIPFLDSAVQLKGRLRTFQISGAGRGKKLKAIFEDSTGSIELVWFQGHAYITKTLEIGQTYQLYGKAKKFGSSWNIPHPELTPWEKVDHSSGYQGVYPSTEKLSDKGLHSKGIAKITSVLVDLLHGKIDETLPDYIRQNQKLIGLEEAYRSIHLPSHPNHIPQAIYRLKFEELFFLQLELLQRKQISFEKGKGFVFSELKDFFNQFYQNHLPFELTNAQKRVVKEVRKDVWTGKHMNRLIQGDVGSGKTLVALLTMLIACDNGFQAALMAPTEILAQQHYHTISELLEKMPIEIRLLTGSVSKKDRLPIHEGLQNGTTQLLIGTHALLENEVQFKNLGLVVIDEQHRFGVAQRARMWKKNSLPPHVLIMTATPIPRTLAMTFYGDLDVSVIDELPPGRKPITTVHRTEANRLRVFGFMKEEIKKGRQVYVVYPLIEENAKLELNSLMEGYEAISRAFPLPEYKISMVHGKMKPKEKDFEMQRFVKGETQIMVATTVIEVGVNVPNASVMIIENAERFGLSQLHQLRGRVGRGAEQSFCILVSTLKLSKEGKKRMETMVRTNDGFEIAEVDLELRGPGDIMGTQQSGELPLKLSNLVLDGALVVLTRDFARSIIEDKSFYQLPEWTAARTKLSTLLKARPNWGKIS